MYSEFSIDFWYYPDSRFRYKRYFTSDSDRSNYPLTMNSRIVFLSDCCKVTYNYLYLNNGGSSI